MSTTEASRYRRCPECGDVFEPARTHHHKTVCTTECGEARARRQARARNYGLSVEAYDELLAKHEGCAICGAPETYEKRLRIDHDHACCAGNRSCGACVRGLLCNSCNLGLGAFQDDVDRLLAAVDYLHESRKVRGAAV